MNSGRRIKILRKMVVSMYRRNLYGLSSRRADSPREINEAERSSRMQDAQPQSSLSLSLIVCVTARRNMKIWDGDPIGRAFVLISRDISPNFLF